MNISSDIKEVVIDNQSKERAKLEELRNRIREAKSAYRAEQRELSLKKKRFIEDLLLSDCVDKDELINLAKSLKQKSKVNCNVLKVVMNSLLENQENIKAFMSVDGALQALLRALSGQNEKFQLLAARCICNLGLGNSKLAFQVLKAADSYLLAHLAGKNIYLIEACACAVGNLSSHGKKHVQLLLVQGFISKLIQLLDNFNETLEPSLIYAITQVVYHGFNILREEDLINILQATIPIFKKKSFLVVYLFSILSASKSCHQILYHHQIHIQVLVHLMVSLKDNDNDAVYYLRILSNCVSNETSVMCLDLIQEPNNLFENCLKILLESDKKFLKKECLGLIGNLLNHSSSLIADFGLKIFQENFELVEKFIKTWKNECSTKDFQMLQDYV